MTIPESDLQAVMKIGADSPFLLLELGVNIGAHFKALTWTFSMVQGGLGGYRNHEDYRFDMLNLSLGAALDLHRIYKRKKSGNAVSDPSPL